MRCYIPRIGDGKSWKGMPVRDSEGKMQATAPYGYAWMMEIRAAVGNEMEGNSDESGISKRDLTKGGSAVRAQASEASLTPYILRHPCCGNEYTLVYPTRLVQCLTSINRDAFAGSARYLYSWQLRHWLTVTDTTLPRYHPRLRLFRTPRPSTTSDTTIIITNSYIPG